MRTLALLLLLRVLTLLLLCSPVARATQEQIAAAQTRKLLADRAWFSQIARVKQRADPLADGTSTTPPAAAAQEARSTSGSCSPADPSACLLVVEPLQPGATVEGYELVERTALLGVCNQQQQSGRLDGDGGGALPAAQIAPEQQQQQQQCVRDGQDVDLAAENDEALELVLPSQYDADSEDQDESESESGAEADGDDDPVDDDVVVEVDSSNLVCALPIGRGSGDASTQVAQTTTLPDGLADGPTLEYQCLLESKIDLIYVNANYRLRRKFDAGSHGEVWKATRRVPDGGGGGGGEQQFVLKRLFLHLGEQMVQMGLREAHFGRLLAREPHVTRFVEYFFRPSAQSGDDDDSDDGSAAQPQQQELWLVFYDEGISLRHYLYAKREATHSGVIFEPSPFWTRLRTDANGEGVFREILRQLLQSVAALHVRGITHRDIKPSNILVNSATSHQSGVPVVKLADFGSAVDAFTLRHLYPSGHGPSQAEETREYQPPEVLFNDLGPPYDYETPSSYDLWSVGVVFLEMLLGSPQVFMISPRARAKLDAALRAKKSKQSKRTTKKKADEGGEDEQQTRRKSYLLHVLSHEFCIFQPAPHQLRALWNNYALSSDGCNFGKFNLTIIERDPLHKGLANPWGLDLLWKLLQWHPAQRIPAAQALEHAFFKGAYTCDKSGRAFATKQELAVHEAYLKVQEARDNEMAFAVRDKHALPSAFACPHCNRSFSTVASCEQHLVARKHDVAAHTRFCNFDARALQQAVSAETQAYEAAEHAYSSFTPRAAVGVALFQGRKKYMEDFVLVDANAQLGFDLYAISDGHLGTRAAGFTVEHLLQIISRNFALLPAMASITTAEREFAEQVALRQSFLELHSAFLQSTTATSSSSPGSDEHNDDFSGCTLTVVLHFRGEQRLVSANVGDSRAIALLRRQQQQQAGESASEPREVVVPLSVDHWPNAAEERSRIESSGGFVSFAGLWRVVGQLAVSRSIGDQHLRQYVSAEPSVFHTDLSQYDEQNALLVIASDGLWETVSNDDAQRFVREQQRKKRSGNNSEVVDLRAMAMGLVIEGYVRGSQDNLAVILVKL